MVSPSATFSLSGKRVREWRLAKGLTQDDLGNAIGVEGPTISRLENGKLKLSSERLSQIAEALGCELSDIAAGPPPHPASEGALQVVISAIEAHWQALGTDYARDAFTEDLQRHFPRLKL